MHDSRYRPNDLPQTYVHEQLDNKYKSGARPEARLSLFLDIQKKFKPVMRHYFAERHKIPIDWFAMRLNYTRSVATTSIVGHILGLGDRHVANILMDNSTGQVVHIDLGIAFEQVGDSVGTFPSFSICVRANFSKYPNASPSE